MRPETLLTRRQVADQLGVRDENRFSDARYLQRLGLPRVKLGRLVRFRQSDIDRLIRRGLERLPTPVE